MDSNFDRLQKTGYSLGMARGELLATFMYRGYAILFSTAYDVTLAYPGDLSAPTQDELFGQYATPEQAIRAINRELDRPRPLGEILKPGE